MKFLLIFLLQAVLGLTYHEINAAQNVCEFNCHDPTISPQIVDTCKRSCSQVAASNRALLESNLSNSVQGVSADQGPASPQNGASTRITGLTVGNSQGASSGSPQGTNSEISQNASNSSQNTNNEIFRATNSSSNGVKNVQTSSNNYFRNNTQHSNENNKSSSDSQVIRAYSLVTIVAAIFSSLL